ncbi:amino acid permease [Necator americanus]|uniref:Amino acid permease n=1 Tax=Necator americanus TaxID=51031 RepID=W2SYI9_NECAM|nr:amino acid permease [Necator americanus]ETN73971.1 amino acid permease [Necator americanus]
MDESRKERDMLRKGGEHITLKSLLSDDEDKDSRKDVKKRSSSLKESVDRSGESDADKEKSDKSRREKREDKSLAPSDKKRDQLFGDADEKDTGKGLKRTLTLTNCVTMIVGCIIGSGIFVSPTGIQEAAGSVGASLAMWILCGIWCGMGAYIYAELGTMITKSGGDYAYMMAAFGPFLAFLRLWIESIVVRPCAITIVALTFALYLLRPIYPTCNPPEYSTEIIAGLLIVILGAINCWSVKVATLVQDWTTYAKVVALIMVIVTGAYYAIFGGPKYRESFEHIFEGNFRNLYQASLFAERVYGRLAFIIPLCVAVSTIGSANGTLMTGSRLFYCGAREGQMPVLLTMINKRLRTPIPAVVFTCVVSIGYLFMSSNLYVLINASQITAWLAITTVAIAMLRLRCKYPDAPRPVKVNLIIPIVFVMGSSCIVILPIFGSPMDTGNNRSRVLRISTSSSPKRCSKLSVAPMVDKPHEMHLP